MSKNRSLIGKIEWGRIVKKLSPYTIKKGFLYFKHYGPKEFGSAFMNGLSRRRFPMAPGMNYMPRMKRHCRSRERILFPMRLLSALRCLPTEPRRYF